MRQVFLLLLVACSSPAAPPVRPPPPAVTDARVADAQVADAGPVQPENSTDVGPAIDGQPRYAVPQDHELTLTTATERITIRDPDPTHVEVAPLDDPAGPVHSADATWAVARDPKKGAIVAGVLVSGRIAKPVVVHRGTTLIRFLGALEQQRTVVLDGGSRGMFVARSQNGGATWTETKLDVASRSIATARHTYDLVTNDARWIRIDRQGDVTTTPIERVVSNPFTCASHTLWVPFGGRLLWFADGQHGHVAARASGPMTCADDAVLVPVDGGLIRCTQAGCGAVQPAGPFADLTSDGIVTATQRGALVRIERTGRAAIDLQLDAGHTLVGIIAPNDVTVLVVLGASKRLHLAVAR